MAKRLPPLTSLPVFEAAARRMSFLHAANELGVTPGAVSRQIQGLESHLGTALFTRANRSIELTAAGRAYAQEIQAALERISSATERARAPGRRRPLSICAYQSFAIRWLIPRWRSFHDQHPEIDVQLATTLEPVDLVRDGFDAAVMVGEGKWPGFAAMKLCPITVFPVCSPKRLKGRAPLQEPRDLVHHPLIHATSRPDDWPRWLDEAGAGDVDGRRGVRFENQTLAYQAAIDDVGIALGIQELIADELTQGRLVQPFKYVRQTRSSFYLVYPKGDAAHPQLAAFLRWIEGEILPAT
ncbi:MAG: transcriptional regulator [Proteobacteria bacterium SG_bin9]|nr:MAG: transcriptional regulator [Proteobacteria bacterium SG_bin9]